VWEHRCDLRHNRHDNKYLQNAWNKYGEDAFTFSPIVWVDEANLAYYEQRFLDANYGAYNIATDATSPTRGRKQTPEHIAKVAAANRGTKRTDEQKKRIADAIRESRKRKPLPPLSQDARDRISKAKKGRKRTPETIQCMKDGWAKRRQRLAQEQQGLAI
jgi:hypothetical protein